MTPQEHTKYLGISHAVYGIFMCLLGLLMMTMMAAFMAPGAPVGLILMSVFILAIYSLMTVPSLIAAYGLLKQKRWAKTAAIVGAVTAAMNFPIGTAVCVYTFWFLFSEPRKAIFDRPNYALPPSRQDWASNVNQQQSEYVPPPNPPDWR